MSRQRLSVAAPWNLSHYIPLNGFHPLYRALFDHAPASIKLSSWDNVRLHKRLNNDVNMHKLVSNSAYKEQTQIEASQSGTIARSYLEHFGAPNKVFTEELAGEIEFHHTAPFPSLKRPFVFHCESFKPIFTPFVLNTRGKLAHINEIKEYYRGIFANPLCLGIYSHIPETLENIRRFFSDENIDKKLFTSRIGLSSTAVADCENIEKRSITKPIFLFLNSANQNPEHFFVRGGHIVLRFWKEFRKSGKDGLLILRCPKPSEKDLLDHGVDASFVSNQQGNRILWVENYLSNRDLNSLMAKSNFLLLPSNSLHSASILHAMKMAVIPVVTDTVGTSVYVMDVINGIVLRGVRATSEQLDSESSVYFREYSRNSDLEVSLISQLTNRLTELIDDPAAYEEMKQRLIAHNVEKFCGKKFGADFWNSVVDAHQRHKNESFLPVAKNSNPAQILKDCKLTEADWPRVFEGTPKPTKIIFTGENSVWRMGGAVILLLGNPKMRLHDWCVFAHDVHSTGFKLIYSNNLADLEHRYLHFQNQQMKGVIEERAGIVSTDSQESKSRVRRKVTRTLSMLLMPFTRIHALMSALLKIIRQYKQYRKRLRRYFYFLEEESTSAPEFEVVLESVSDYDIIRFFHRFYAVPHSEGEIYLKQLVSRNRAPRMSGLSVDTVIRKIASAVCIEKELLSDIKANLEPKLLSENVHGFNIVEVGDTVYAILQTEGRFEYEKLLSGQYVCPFVGQSPTQLEDLIMARASLSTD